MIIRARLKPVEALDPQLLCCKAIRGYLEQRSQEQHELQIYPEYHRVKSHCQFCGTTHELTKAPLITPFHGFRSVFLEFCDLDEGTVQ